MDRDQRKALVLIGCFALLLVGAFLFFGWRGFFGGNGQSVQRQAFAEASPTPKANARQAAETEGEITTVQGPKLEVIKPVASPSPSARPQAQPQQKKTNYEMVAYYTASQPVATPTPLPDPKLYLPRATLIPCGLILTVDSSSRDTPVLAEVTQDVKAFGGSGKVVIPAGTLVAGFATPNRVRDRIEVKGSWDLIFVKTGKEYEFRGIACDRIYDQNTGRYGLTDGSAGLHGQIFYTDQYAELKAFGAAALAGVAQSFQTVQGNYYGGNNLQHTPENAGLQGLSNVMELMVQRYLSANDGDETYVRVPASKEFYVFTTSVIEPERASTGAYEQGAKAQTLWEKIEASKEEIKQSGISPELKQMLNDMAQRQAQLDKLKAQASPGPSPGGNNPF
jgi:Bacterial conjugation TrbI-like protein